MILFCDTSALIKLYIKEEFSAEVQAQAVAAKGIVVSRIAWAEAMAALARRVLWRYPLMTWGVMARIHWQALRLWLKRTPWFARPI